MKTKVPLSKLRAVAAVENGLMVKSKLNEFNINSKQAPKGVLHSSDSTLYILRIICLQFQQNGPREAHLEICFHSFT